VTTPTAPLPVDTRAVPGRAWLAMARSLYKGERLGKQPPCALCAGAGEGPRARVTLTHGVSVWLCAGHRAPEFLRRRAGRDFVATLGAVWSAAGCLTARRDAALEAHLGRVRSAGRVVRARPGSYAWPALRREAERRFAAGEAPAAVVASLCRRPPASAERAPSARTLWRWFNEGRWLGPEEAGGARPPGPPAGPGRPPEVPGRAPGPPVRQNRPVGADAKFGVGLSVRDAAGPAAAEACRAARAGLGRDPATIAVVFASPDLCADAETLLATIDEHLAPEHLIGCMGEAIVGAGREVEEGSALVIWAAHLPGAEVIPFRLVARPVDEGVGVLGWPERIDQADAGAVEPIILLADPFTFPADGLLTQLNTEPAGNRVVGGLASGGRRPGDHRLFAGTDVMSEGAVGLALRGVRVRTIVSQGCAPIGPEMVITSSQGQLVHELAGAPAVEKLEEVVATLTPEERTLAAEGLVAGLVIDENRPDYGRGDFLIRAIHGGDRESGALMVGEHVRVGQTMRFHVRDARSADEDLREALRVAREELGDSAPGGVLVFTCNGRGSHMFGRPDHDASAIVEELGDVPAAGVFCNGEMGPVGGKNFLHGFTATMALFALESDAPT
jgi:small ligand-binding sensory domain FIST